MTFVVTEACIRCKFTDCVSVCPVDCFHEGPNFLVIDPESCIDCAVCVPECPVGAIVADTDVPAGQEAFVQMNARLAAQWPVITQAREPLPAAKEWSDSQRSLQAYFLGNISHEFRTPLAGMKVSLELLLENARDLSPAELDELLNSLHLSISSMGQLIDNLLESSKIEAEQLVLRRVTIDTQALIADAARLVQPFLNRRRQRLSVDVPLMPVSILADSTRLVQVLVNLIANASKYSPTGGAIDISVERQSGATRVVVADRGAGIPDDKRDGVFKRFVRLGATASEDYGAGLGLSVVKAIVEAHGGAVGVDARGGGGSRFWFSLPEA